MNDRAWELLRAWQGGDAKAGNGLIDLVFPQIARFFRNKVTQAADEDDLAQKTLLALLRVRPRSTDGPFTALLYGIMRNVLTEYIREKYKRTKEANDFGTVCVHDLDVRSVSSIAARTRELRAFVQALRKIPLDDQVVLELRFFEGLTAQQIADALGIARGSVHRVVERGIDRLREQVGRELRGPAPRTPTADAIERWASTIRSTVEADASESRKKDRANSAATSLLPT